MIQRGEFYGYRLNQAIIKGKRDIIENETRGTPLSGIISFSKPLTGEEINALRGFSGRMPGMKFEVARKTLQDSAAQRTNELRAKRGSPSRYGVQDNTKLDVKNKSGPIPVGAAAVGMLSGISSGEVENFSKDQMGGKKRKIGG